MIDFGVLVTQTANAFGDPTMMFVPSTGEQAFAVTGVFHKGSRLMNLAEGVEYVSEVPTVSIPVTLVMVKIGRAPLQDDQIEVPSDGNAYIVREVRPDGLGNAWCLLNLSGALDA